MNLTPTSTSTSASAALAEGTLSAGAGAVLSAARGLRPSLVVVQSEGADCCVGAGHVRLTGRCRYCGHPQTAAQARDLEHVALDLVVTRRKGQRHGPESCHSCERDLAELLAELDAMHV